MAKIYIGDKEIMGGGQTDTLPIGSEVKFPSATIPDNWLLENGQAVSRTTYAELFAVIGTTYGSGDGSTTFNVPDMQGVVPVGLDSTDADFDALGETGGAKTHVHGLSVAGAALADSAAKAHFLNTWTANVATNVTFPGGASGSKNTNLSIEGDTDTGSSVQPYAVFNWIIKAKNTVPITATVVDNLLSTSSTDALSAGQGKVLADRNTDSGWIAVTSFSASWVNFGSIYQDAAYRKIGNQVFLRGLVKDGTIGSAIFTLPTGYRPADTVLMSTISNNAAGRVDVASTGNVACTLGNNSYVTLDNLSFFID